MKVCRLLLAQNPYEFLSAETQNEIRNQNDKNEMIAKYTFAGETSSSQIDRQGNI